MIALAAFLLGVGLPETYNRSILRRQAARHGLPPPKLLLAQSGVTLRDMAQVTVVTPIKMLFREPIVALISIGLAFNFAVLFQFFIAVPAVLHLVYGFAVQKAGLAFIAAILGSLLAAATSIVFDRVTDLRLSKKTNDGMVAIEYRLLPAMLGGFFMTGSLFWIGWTAKPTISYASPILGTLLYVWGSMSVLVSPIPEKRLPLLLRHLSDGVCAADFLSRLPLRRLSTSRDSLCTHYRCVPETSFCGVPSSRHHPK